MTVRHDRPMTIEVALVVAMAENGVIGRGGDLPWRIPADLRRFKAVTMGKPIVMGRRTFESIGRPLPGRPNIVVTRDGSRRWDGARTAKDFDGALALARRRAEADGVSEVMVIGGAGVYRAALPRVDRIYLTRIHEPVDGDTVFPDWDETAWREVSREDRDDIYSSRVSFSVLERARCWNGPRLDYSALPKTSSRKA